MLSFIVYGGMSMFPLLNTLIASITKYIRLISVEKCLAVDIPFAI